MVYFARQDKMLPPLTGEMIKNVRILVVGVGAGGNESAKNLVLMGFGNITVVDLDLVEDSNLSRTVVYRKGDIGKSKALIAAERLKEMALADAPHITGLHGNIMTDFGKGELFMKHDIVISCVDTQECRAFISDWCVRTNTPMFELGFDGFNLNVTFFAPADGYVQVTDGRHIDRLPSSDGLFPIPENRMEVCLREEIGNGTFDGSRNSCSGFKMKDHELMKIPTIQTCSAMAAAILTTELVKYLSGKDTLRNKIIYYYGLRHEAMCFSYKPSKQCIIHQENIPVENIEVAKDDTLGEILRKISDKYYAQPLMSVTPFVISGHCASCGCEMTVGKLETEMYDDERWCPECRTRYADYSTRLLYPNQWKRTPFELTLSSRNEILAMRPCDIGIPEGDIVKVTLTSDEGICQKFLWLKSN